MAKTVIAQIKRFEQLDQVTIDAMFSVFREVYDCIDFAKFKIDLAAKDFVILLVDSSEKIQGFSTLQLIKTTIAQTPISAVFSGDTVISNEYRGSLVLAQSWLKLVGALYKNRKASEKWYWFLIVKGEKTYRFLPYYFYNFYPNWNTKTPDFEKTIMDQLAFQKFGSDYKKDLGVIQFQSSHGHLNSREALIEQHKTLKPEIEFFIKKNPGYFQGDELVCLAEISADNFRTWALKPFLSGLDSKEMSSPSAIGSEHVNAL